jgi:hypothetical protein
MRYWDIDSLYVRLAATFITSSEIRLKVDPPMSVDEVLDKNYLTYSHLPVKFDNKKINATLK